MIGSGFLQELGLSDHANNSIDVPNCEMLLGGGEPNAGW